MDTGLKVGAGLVVIIGLVIGILGYPVFRDSLLRQAVYIENSVTRNCTQGNFYSCSFDPDPIVTPGTEKRTEWWWEVDPPVRFEYGYDYIVAPTIFSGGYSIFIPVNLESGDYTFTYKWLTLKRDLPLGTVTPLALSAFYWVALICILLVMAGGVLHINKRNRRPRSYRGPY